jgi:hypothetical protein
MERQCVSALPPSVVPASKRFGGPQVPLIAVAERSGQLRPYVRPVARLLPLAIMGVPMRVRHQSVGRAQGTRLLSLKDPVSCALMSGLLRGFCRWPSWVFACVSGTNLSGVLKAQGC